jgi:type IV pilus assembly protein PilO
MQLPKLTKQQQQSIAIGVLIVGVGGYLYYAFFWSSFSKKIAEVDQQISEIESKIEKASREAARKGRLDEELKRLQETAAEAERRLPKKKSVADILVTVSTLAKENGVELLSFKPGSQSGKSQFFTELNYPLSVKGSFHEIGRFLSALALEERIFNVQNVQYGSESDVDGKMTIQFTLISYQYKG